MRKFWSVLVSLGLIMAFSTSVFAADAKFSGEFKMQGWYNKNASLIDKDDTATSVDNRGSSAFYTQRLRMGIDFMPVKGVKLGTRFDALERKWMAARTDVPSGSPGIASTDSEAENIAFEIAYLQFFTPIGIFIAGNMPAGQFGTPFNDYVGYDNALIVWSIMKGPWVVSASLKKSQDGATAGTPIGGGTDNDSDSYTLKAEYKWKSGAAGAQLTDVRSRTASTIYKLEVPFMVMYAKNKFGRIFIEDEMMFNLGGKYLDYVNPAATDVDNGFAFNNYFNINVDLAPAKVGFMFVYSPGDDPKTLDKREGGYHATLGNDKTFNPALILFNDDYIKWMNGNAIFGNVGGVTASNPRGYGVSTYFDNVWFYQVYGDFDMTPKLNLGAALSYAYADKKPTTTGWVDEDYGYELDVTMKYKIYNNLEYMIGAAYLWTGDYFKGTDSKAKVADNYLITHKLTLIF